MLELYNTMDREKKPFNPLVRQAVSLYTCGPTVYNYAHIGNLRTYVFEDILKRVLTYNGFTVNHVMNITDVGHLTDDADDGIDKMEKGAAREGKSAWDIAAAYTVAFKDDLAALNIIEPTTWCKATDHIPEQIAVIQKLEHKGFTYRTPDGIYFDTSRLSDYGKLAKLDLKHLQAGARVDIGEKKNATDFALWKFSDYDTKRQMEWDSPWGIGFPGWHIECSAMATKYLGQPFDIHCGGIDHIPVHHTNEIAQSEAAEGKPLANYWLHGEFLLIDNDKMAKSGENFITLQTIKDKGINPLAYRYFLLQAHYRKQLSFSWEALKAAENGLNHLYESVKKLKKLEEKNDYIHEEDVMLKEQKIAEEGFLNCINNDLDTPGTIAYLWEKLKASRLTTETIYKFDKILGLKIEKSVAELENIQSQPVPKNIQELIKRRDEARTSKNWPESDRLRQEIESLGYEVEDTKDGTKVRSK